VSYAGNSLYKGLAIGYMVWHQPLKQRFWLDPDFTFSVSKVAVEQVIVKYFSFFLSYFTYASHLYFIPLPLIYIKLATDSKESFSFSLYDPSQKS
jgi:hypothetical protein